MKTKIRYWLPEQGQDSSDAYEIEADIWDAEDASVEAAEDYHGKHDGWESSWPILITVQAEGVIKTFSVEREAQPHFYAHPSPFAGDTH